VQLPDDTPMPAFTAEALPKLKALPAVRYAALTGRLPLQRNHYGFTAVWFGPVPPPRETWQSFRVPMIGVTPDLFRATGTTIVQGRSAKTTTRARREWLS
jgi:hypothetical protein